MTRRLCLITTFLLLSQALFFTIPNVIADDTSQTANAILDGETITEWICSPDCGSETVDAIDWYTITLQANQPAQIFIENLDDFSAVELSASLFVGNDSNLNSSVNIGSNDNNSLSINVQQETELFISIEANDGFSHDGTNYSITLLVETDNHATSATPIEVGNFLDVGYVCIADCPGGVVDSEDWYYFSVNSGDQIGIVAEELTWFSYLDFELYVMDSQNNPVLHTYEYHGGSAGGPQDYSVRAWFNATSAQDIYVRVFTNQSDDVLYNLSVSRGEWVDVTEDDFHWISFPNLNFGDTLRVQAIRTDVPNDLDILLFNATEFELYRNEVVNNESSSPEELMVVEDCLVCSFSFTLSNEVAGLTNAKPESSHSSTQTITWNPSLYFVADYTDYRSNPPANSQIDSASVFLSVSLLDSASVVENYELFVANETGMWAIIDSGAVADGYISPPNGAWEMGQTSITNEKSSSTFRLVVTDSSNGEVHSDSQFEIYNYRPKACVTISGDLNGDYVEGLPILFDATCSYDLDNDDLSYSWKISGIEVSTSEKMSVNGSSGQLDVQFELSDNYSSNDTVDSSIGVVSFPTSQYPTIDSVEYALNASYTINSQNVLYDNNTISPEWTDWEIIGSQIGIGLGIESRITQYSETTLLFDHDNASKETQVILSQISSRTETALKVNLILIVRNVDNGTETIYDMPMPTSEEIYENQSSIPIPQTSFPFFKTVYYWDRLAVVDDGIWIDGMSSNTQLDLEMPTLDLIKYIELVIQAIPGSQLPLIFLGIAVDYNLYIDIDLDFDINNEGDIQIFYRPEPTSNGLYFDSTLTVDQQDNETCNLYPFTTLDSSIDIYGSIGLRLRIAQPGWLTFGLGYLVDDPMFLEGNWEAEVVNSEGPLATSHNIQYMLSNASVGATKIVFIPEDEPPIDNQSNDDPIMNNTDTNNDTSIVNNTETNNDGNSGITNSSSDEELDSESLNENAPIYIGISCLTVLFASMMFVMKIRKRRRLKSEVGEVITPKGESFWDEVQPQP